MFVLIIIVEVCVGSDELLVVYWMRMAIINAVRQISLAPSLSCTR